MFGQALFLSLQFFHHFLFLSDIDSAVRNSLLSEGKSSSHDAAGHFEFPGIFLGRVRGAGERSLIRRQALERPHEYQLALHHFVSMQSQLAGDMLDRRDAIDDMFVMAG